MTICQFFLQGRCRFGDRCWNEHPGARGASGGRQQPQQQSSGSSRRGWNASNQRYSGVIQPSSFSKSTPWGGSKDQEKSSLGSFEPGTSAGRDREFGLSQNPFALLSPDEQKEEKKLLEGIVKDMEVWESSGQWMFSVYSPMKKEPNISGSYCYEIPDKDFRNLVLSFLKEIKENTGKVLEEIRETMQEQNEKLNKEIEALNEKQLEIPELDNKITELNNSLEGHRSRIETLEGGVSKIENKKSEMTQFEEQMETRMKKLEQNIRAMWDTIKKNNIRIMGIPEEEERVKSSEKIFEEILAENFPNIMEDKKIFIEEAQRTPYRLNPKRNTPRHIIIKLSRTKDKERILRAAREKQNITYKGASIRLTADFSSETMQARRQWDDIYKILKEKNCQPRIVYPAKLSFKTEGEIKIFPDKQKLREFVTNRPALQEILKGVLQKENQ
ncbi:nucleoporin NUP42 isoform X1 [Loxodonta africana]|uniref:nucleoporin NUP42 isoform X1 n=1 Tax=Loxodonta africana TaxID=9785 RepID=UPI0030D4292A